MSNVLVREFSIIRDFRSVAWGATLRYNLLRAVGAGIVFGILMFTFPRTPTDQHVALFAPLAWPIFYGVFLLPMGLLAASLSAAVPFAGLFAAFLAVIGVTAGDPLVLILSKFAPAVVPIDAPPLLSLKLIWYVLKGDRLKELVIAA